MLVALSLLCGCSDDEKKVRRGLLSNNLCFTTQGGDISNQIICNSLPWKVIVPDNAQGWISFKPNSGLGITDTTNLIISVLVNNNPLSRSTAIRRSEERRVGKECVST